MVPPNLVFLVSLWLSVFNLNCAESRKVSHDGLPSPTVCMNCTICQYPCHSLTPPPPQFPDQPQPEPIYGSPPPPPSGYPAPPPPQVDCSQVPPGCCQQQQHHPPPPSPLGFGYNQPPPYPFSGGAGGYQPVVENYSGCLSPYYVISVMVLLFSFILLL